MSEDSIYPYWGKCCICLRKIITEGKKVISTTSGVAHRDCHDKEIEKLKVGDK